MTGKSDKTTATGLAIMDPSGDLDRSIDRLLANLGISEAELAQALDVSERSIKRWQAGKSFPQYESRARLEELDALAERLRESFPDLLSIHHWLREPNAVTDGSPLVDAITSDRFELVERALMQQGHTVSQ